MPKNQSRGERFFESLLFNLQGDLSELSREQLLFKLEVVKHQTESLIAHLNEESAPARAQLKQLDEKKKTRWWRHAGA